MLLNPNFKFIELHNHLDGSITPDTLFRLAAEKNMHGPHTTVESLKNFLKMEKPYSLCAFLQKFDYVLPIIRGDQKAIAEICDDFVRTAAESRVCYIEARLCPHLLSTDSLSVDSVVNTILSSFSSAENKYGVVTRTILSTMRQDPLPNPTCLELAIKYKPHGIVGIDLAGDEQHSEKNGGTYSEIISLFENAKKEGIHRTVHAGESGSVNMIKEAVDKLHAERIGHGYRVLQDKNFYAEMKEKNIHFEICPTSSFLTGAVTQEPERHTIHTFINDKINYSINCDDYLITTRNLREEYEYCKTTFNITDEEFQRTNFNAAYATFLDETDREELVEHLRKNFKTIH